MSYRFVGSLAEGGFSQVFEVEDTESALAERLVLKRLTAAMSARPEVQSAFAEEAKILRELRHPNVVTFRRCYFDEQRRICLLMEKVSGEPLDHWAARQERSQAVLDVFDRILGAVDYLHHRTTPFLHLDLKPDNVLVRATPEGCEPVIIDFGIARRSGRPGLKAFTPPYGAPEQEAGGALDCSTDVYALGQILAELLDVLAPPAPPDHALRQVAAKAARPRRRERYADAGELRLAFRRARGSAGTAPTAPTARPAAAPALLANLPRRAIVAAAAAVVLVAVGLLGFLAWRAVAHRSEPPVTVAVEGAVPSLPAQARFVEVQFRFEQALIQDRPEAAELYRQARELSDSAPAGSDSWRWMKHELDAMSNHLSVASGGGPAAEWVRSELQTKHLNRPDPQPVPVAAGDRR